MKTFAVRDGDLVLGQGGHQMISGQAKVRQDLGMMAQEPYGGDRFHPRWGSMLPRYIGGVGDLMTEQLIRSEVIRLVANYMSKQADLVAQDRAEGRRTRFDAGELVIGVDTISVSAQEDSYRVRVTVRTLDRRTLTLVTTVAGG